jgi:hypothetical protein
MDCTFPANGGVAGSVAVTATNLGGATATLSSAYTYTAVGTPPAIGSGHHVFCILQFPKTISQSTTQTTTVFGQVFFEGVTDQTPAPAAVAGLTGQVGYGASGADPTASNFTWIDGVNNDGFSGNVNNREYKASLNVGTVGSYDYAYRFSNDAGATYYYCDGDGSDNGYSTDQGGKLTVTP